MRDHYDCRRMIDYNDTWSIRLYYSFHK